jgi:hypothetical protein
VGGDVAADAVDAADDFMAGNDGIFDAGKLGVDDVKVGPANPQALTVTRISPSPGRGSGRSCIWSGAPGAGNTIARICFSGDEPD